MKTRFTQSIIKRVIGTSLATAALALPVHAQFVSTLVSSNLNEPSSIAVDNNGVAYIADSGNNRIEEFNPLSGTLSTLAGTGTEGTNNGKGGAEFFNPTGIAYARGGLVVVDQGNQLIRFVTLDGTVSTLAGIKSPLGGFVDGPAATAQFRFPSTVVADGAGNLYIADSGNNAIRLIDINNVVHTVQVNNYEFDFPEGLTLDNNNDLWIADTLNNTICVISNISVIVNQSVTVIAGAPGENGTNDSLAGTDARFNLPSGLFWDSSIESLIVADTGNDTIRNVFLTNGTGSVGWAVRTIAGVPLVAGFVNGAPLAALFSQPAAIATDPTDVGLYVVDSANSAIRVFLPTPPEPQVSAPVFGFVTFPLQGSPPAPESQFNASSNAVFNNFSPPILALQTESGTETYITFGPTPTDPLNNTIPLPGPATGQSPEPYRGDGLPPADSAPSIIQPIPDVTIYAVSQAPGRKPSPVVSARYQFVVANPVITGINAAAIQLSDTTVNSQLFYTLDGSTPENDGSNTNSVGPIASGQVIALNLVTNVTLSVRGFETGFAPSGVSFENLSVSNFQGNELTFGFPTGEEGSSAFVCTPGQRFYAPVTLTLLPAATMFSLQFNVTVTNLGAAPPAGTTFDFTSMLEKPDPTNNVYFVYIPPAMFAGGGNFTNGLFTNTDTGLLGVGWLERATKTNLYPTTSQDLITFSQAKDDQFLSSGGKVIVGGYSFVIPATATPGQAYQIQLARPSATADGIGVKAAPVAAPTNGALGSGSISALKHVTVGVGGVGPNELSYLVGDVNDFRWFNVGDFGDNTLDNSDVEEVFQSAIYGLNTPAAGSDLFDAMDSSDAQNNNSPGLYTAIFEGTGSGANAVIDAMQLGDGNLDISDVYVTFRRSLDPSLAWIRRFWGTDGNRHAAYVANAPAQTSVARTPVKTGVSVPHTMSVAAGQVVASGATAVVPLQVQAADPNGLPIRTLMFDIQVQPLDGSPALTSPISFSGSPGLGAPYTTLSKSPEDLAAVWLDPSIAGISGTSLIGNLNITLPAGVTAQSAYQVLVLGYSASPNGLGVFQSTVQNGLVTLSDRSASSWNDGISDAWRLLHFGTISDPASAANADPDGDGASNWQEYLAGTDPLNAASVFKLNAGPSANSAVFTLQWPTVVGKHYTLQSSSSPNGSWTTVLSNVGGTGNPMNWTDTSGTQAKFFRAVVQ